MRFPTNLQYTKDHEWLQVDGKTATIGITDHAQSSLGDIVYVDLPKIGRELKVHETFGVVESIKAVSDLYAPVAGKVTEVNSALIEDPAQITRDPQGAAWMIRIDMSATPDGLMDASSYEKYVSTLK